VSVYILKPSLSSCWGQTLTVEDGLLHGDWRSQIWPLQSVPRIWTIIQLLWESRHIKKPEKCNFQAEVSCGSCNLYQTSWVCRELQNLTCRKFSALMQHHFLCKSSQYIWSVRLQLSKGSVVCLTDFAENCSFIINDPAQGFTWNVFQAILHTFVFYLGHEEIQTFTYFTYCHQWCDRSCQCSFLCFPVMCSARNNGATKYFYDPLL
jgi:hypothetical protein